jgi:hypothetical protein
MDPSAQRNKSSTFLPVLHAAGEFEAHGERGPAKTPSLESPHHAQHLVYRSLNNCLVAGFLRKYMPFLKDTLLMFASLSLILLLSYCFLLTSM